MSYKHILVAVDLSPESRLLLDKAVGLAKCLKADLFLFHDDLIYSGEFASQLYDPRYAINSEVREMKEPHAYLRDLIENAGYTIKGTYVGSGKLTGEIEKAVTEYNADLVVCGHHHDFWHRFSSSASQLLKSSSVDLMVIPLK